LGNLTKKGYIENEFKAMQIDIENGAMPTKIGKSSLDQKLTRQRIFGCATVLLF